MCDSLSEKLGNPAKKMPTSTMSVNHENETSGSSTNAPTPKAVDYSTIDMNEFCYFVPIENNTNDFELGQIINDIEEIEAKNDQYLKGKQVAVRQEKRINVPNQNDAANQMGNTFNSQVWNVNQAQNNPFVPRMWFPNSTIAINYNFGNANKSKNVQTSEKEYLSDESYIDIS